MTNQHIFLSFFLDEVGKSWKSCLVFISIFGFLTLTSCPADNVLLDMKLRELSKSYTEGTTCNMFSLRPLSPLVVATWVSSPRIGCHNSKKARPCRGSTNTTASLAQWTQKTSCTVAMLYRQCRTWLCHNSHIAHRAIQGQIYITGYCE